MAPEFGRDHRQQVEVLIGQRCADAAVRPVSHPAEAESSDQFGVVARGGQRAIGEAG